MSRKCTCIRCQAEDLVRRIYPDIDDSKAKLVAEKMVKALRSVVGGSGQ